MILRLLFITTMTEFQPMSISIKATIDDVLIRYNARIWHWVNAWRCILDEFM